MKFSMKLLVYLSFEGTEKAKHVSIPSMQVTHNNHYQEKSIAPQIKDFHHNEVMYS